MNITQIRNATLVVNYADTKFLIDPWFSPKDYMPGFDAAVNADVRQPRVDLPCKIDEIVADIDAVIVTHVHPDHWDEFAQKALDKNIKMFVQSDIDRQFMLSSGFKNVEVLSDSGTIYNNVELIKTGCQHGRREVVRPLCEQIGMPYDSMGVVFKSESEKTLYIAGDTIWCPEVETALNAYNPDIIVLNACAATVLNGERLIMNLDDIKNVLDAMPKSTIIASHMDTVSHLTLTRKDIKEFIAKNDIKNILVPEDGETMNF